MKKQPKDKIELMKKLLMPVCRYLNACEFEKWAGGDKLDNHNLILKILLEHLGIEKSEDNPCIYQETKIKVHEFTQDILTDRMDEVIGFPTERAMTTSERNTLIAKFVDVLYDYLGEIKKIHAKNKFK